MRPRRGFTLMEMMVVLVVIGTMAAFGAGIITPQISYFRSRKDAENLLMSLRRVRSLAATRGHAQGDYGLAIFRGALTVDRQTVVGFDLTSISPFSYVEFSDRNNVRNDNDRNMGEVSRPVSTNLAAAVGENEPETATRVSFRPTVINLHEETSLAGASGLAIPDGTQLVFDEKGRLDTRPGRTTPGGLISETEAYCFDVVNPNVGWYRVRVRFNGTIEMSAANDISDRSNAYTYRFDGTLTGF